MKPTSTKAFSSIALAILAAVVLAGGFLLLNDRSNSPQQIAADPKSASYHIDDREVVLGTGSVQYFGNELRLDLDGDDFDDSVFLITNSPGGSGTFYYVVAALQGERGYVGSKAFFVGDRIAPQNITIGGEDAPIAVNYADRAPGESFSVRPSVGKTLWLRFDVDAMEFVQVEPPFEAPPLGIATSSAPAALLTAKKWIWVSTTYGDGTKILPKKAGSFVITFAKDGAFSASTDCNSIGGQYDATGHLITFKNVISTLMYCEASQEGDFQKTLGQAASYFFSPSGEFVLDLKYDSGSAVFK